MIFVNDFGKVISPRPYYQTMNLPDGAIARLGKGDISYSEVAFSPNGEQLAVASNIGIWLYDVATTCEVALLTEHEYTPWIEAVVFSPDGATIASTEYHTVKLRDAKTGRLTATLGHNRGVFTVAFSPDGATVASAGYAPVTLWDAKTGHMIATLEGPDSIVLSVAFSPDGTTIASGDTTTQSGCGIPKQDA